MKKLTLILTLLVAMVTTAMAQTEGHITYTINTTNGKCYKDGTSLVTSGFYKKWQSNDDLLTLTVGANNMTNGSDDTNLQLWVGSGCTYTITAPDGYYVSSYSFDYEKVADNIADYQYYITQNNEKYYPDEEARTLSVNNLVSKTTSFTMNGSNNGVYARNFTVTIRKYSALPELTTDENAPKYYTIQNVRTKKYVRYRDNTNWLQQNPYLGEKALFYFTGEVLDNGHLKVKIHNKATDNKMADFGKWDTDGSDWYIRAVEAGYGSYPGMAISKADALTDNTEDSWNSYDSNSEVGNYWSNDGGSTFVFAPYNGQTEQLPQISTESRKNFYYIKGLKNNKYATYDGEGNSIKLMTDKSYKSYWYFVENPDVEAPEGYIACYIYNAANANPVSDPSNGTYAPGTTYYIKKHAHVDYIGFVLYPIGHEDTGWNDAGGHGTSVGVYNYDDNGSIWYFEPVGLTEDCIKNLGTTAKNEAIATVDSYSKAYYNNATAEQINTAKTEINNIDCSTLANALTSVIDGTANAIANEITNYAVAPKAGDQFMIRSTFTNNSIKDDYIRANPEGYVKTTSNIGSTDINALDLVWTLKNSKVEGKFNLYNERLGVYIAPLSTATSGKMGYATEADNAGIYEIVSKGPYVAFHADGQDEYGYIHHPRWDGKELTRWSSDGAASQWQLIEAPIELTTDPETPICYAIKSGRDGNYYFTLENNKIKLVDNADIVGNDNAKWFFMLDGNKNLKIYPYADKENTMGYITIADGNTKLTNDHNAAGYVADTYNLYYNTNNAANNNDKCFAFRPTEGNTFVSNHGGTGNYMGFYNEHNDKGTRIGFENINKVVLKNKIAAWEPYFAHEGDKVCQYIIADEIKTAINNAADIVKTKGSNNDDYATALVALNAVNYPAINMPETGKYYYLNYSGSYLSNVKETTLKATVDKSISNIFYYEGNGENTYLLDYQNGHYVTNPWNIGIGEAAINGHATERYKQTKSFVEGGIGYYALKYRADNGNDYYFTVNGGATNSTTNLTDNKILCTLEEVTTLPVTITAAGYASFYAPVAVELPDGVTAHTVIINGEWATLSEGFTKIPANTGVILAGEENTYELTIIDEEVVLEGNNDLSGTVATEYITSEAYVLANGNNGVGLYLATLNQEGKFQNNSHKAYLPESALHPSAQNSAGFRFSFGDENTTAIEEVETRNEAEEIYDLTGRKLEGITGAGIYIINGKKVLVK